MERVLKPRKLRQTFLSPASEGWRINQEGEADSGASVVSSLAVAAQAIPAESEIHLALPCSAALLERMTLPATDLEELRGMVRLQLEKTLPFAAEDITSDFEVVEQNGQDSVLIAAAVNNTQLDALCEPLRSHDRIPSRITVFVMHVAAACPKDKLTFLIYREEKRLILAVCENAKPIHVETLGASDETSLLEELPHIILTAEMEGIPTHFQLVRLESACADLRGGLASFFGLPVELFSLDVPPEAPSANLIPASWLLERKRLARSADFRSRIALAALLYLILVVAGCIWLFVMNRQVQALDIQLLATQPQIEFIRSRVAKWAELAPAVDPSRYTVEILNQINKALPSESLRITQYDQTGQGFMIEGEAPTASLAIEFLEQLKSNHDLRNYHFDAAPPEILPDEHARFRIFAK